MIELVLGGATRLNWKTIRVEADLKTLPRGRKKQFHYFSLGCPVDIYSWQAAVGENTYGLKCFEIVPNSPGFGDDLVFDTFNEAEMRVLEVLENQQGIYKDDEGRMHRGTIRKEWVRCGKKNCTKCPHGPYAYMYYRTAGGRLKKAYLGRVKE